MKRPHGQTVSQHVVSLSRRNNRLPRGGMRPCQLCWRNAVRLRYTADVSMGVDVPVPWWKTVSVVAAQQKVCALLVRVSLRRGLASPKLVNFQRITNYDEFKNPGAGARGTAGDGRRERRRAVKVRGNLEGSQVRKLNQEN